tara:strand:- start:261 stop:842 length:582 start_codon:yes stop_codon:yes gene_type:complete
MENLLGKNKVLTAVFISGKGTNLKKLIQFSKTKNSPIKISLIVSSNSKAEGLKYSLKYKIKKYVVAINDRNFEDKILKNLKINKIQFICLAGYMKILSKKFIKNFKGKIINIHPSLLPKYKGLNTHEKVIKNKEKYTGCTVHYVNDKLDSGKIILQKKIKIFKNDNPKSIKSRVLNEEHQTYYKAILKIFNVI